MTGNSPWISVKDAPMPDGESVLVYLAEPRHGTRFTIYSSRKISNGYMAIVGGLFDFDFGIEILAWRRLEDIEMEIPIGITENPDGVP